MKQCREKQCRVWKVFVLSVAVATSAAIMGCASTPKTDARLDAAHAKFNQLESQTTSGVPVPAPIEFKDATDALAAADKSLADRDDKSIIDHKVYIAQQRVAVAEQAYAKKVSEKALEDSSKNRYEMQLAARTEEATRAKAALEDLQAKMTERGAVMTLGDVLFDVNKSTLKSGALHSIDKLAAFLQAYPQRTVSIEGFTDSTGSDEYNQQLSESRAAAVKAALIARNVAPNRVETHGYGEEFPVASNDNASGRQLNRRVEIVFSDESGHLINRASAH